ncbi:heavy metal-associated isoprenylated plant protein 41-like isoform X1 [Raphanus sativus]|uniref:Heavy metal-associated isoprenylated plant protein 41-like isoform X1 n=2 Tax=Raphanus sativus TaxID=3726 RepID=A0A6J0KTC3_RAPSA|nr:heavy metal-associated isoprenylated plant protein 41-like isoform X1 [Raphanus sativus]
MATITELSRLIRDHGDDEEEVWITHYSSNHQILLVGEGDFSFSCTLATRFRSASNICASSLDTYDDVVRKYKKGRSNLDTLKRLGASLLHGVDATKLQLHPHLNCIKFDRIIFNFPHAGFHGKETDSSLIKKHRELVFGFLHGASHMVRADGEVHVSHKNKPPFCHWKLEELASKCSLALTQCVAFEKSEYPGYENKRGDGSRCDMPFLLGECTTFKFRVSRVAKEFYAEKLKGREMKKRESKCLQAQQKQLQGVGQRPALSFGLSYHQDHNLRQVHDLLVQSRQLRTSPLDPRGGCREHRCSHFEDAIVSSIRAAGQRPEMFNHDRLQENSMQLDHPLRYTERSSHDFLFQPSHHRQEERCFLECSSRFDGVPLDIYIRRMQRTLTKTTFPHLYTEESQERRRQEPFFQRSDSLNGVSHEIYNGEGGRSMLTSASFPGESQEGCLTRQSNLNIYHPPPLW